MASGMFTYWLEGRDNPADPWRRLKSAEFQARGDSRALQLFRTAKRRPTYRLWKLRLMCDEGNGLSGQVGSEVTRATYRKEVPVEDPGAVKLQAVDYEAASKYKSAAAREHVSISETQRTYWFYVVKGDEGVVGVVGLMLVSGGAVRIKGVYIQKEFRGQGIGTAVTDALETHAVNELHATTIEAYAYNRAFYEGRSYEAVGTRPNGAVLLRKRCNASAEAK